MVRGNKKAVNLEAKMGNMGNDFSLDFLVFLLNGAFMFPPAVWHRGTAAAQSHPIVLALHKEPLVTRQVQSLRQQGHLQNTR